MKTRDDLRKEIKEMEEKGETKLVIDIGEFERLLNYLDQGDEKQKQLTNSLETTKTFSKNFEEKLKKSTRAGVRLCRILNIRHEDGFLPDWDKILAKAEKCVVDAPESNRPHVDNSTFKIYGWEH